MVDIEAGGIDGSCGWTWKEWGCTTVVSSTILLKGERSSIEFVLSSLRSHVDEDTVMVLTNISS